MYSIYGGIECLKKSSGSHSAGESAKRVTFPHRNCSKKVEIKIGCKNGADSSYRRTTYCNHCGNPIGFVVGDENKIRFIA